MQQDSLPSPADVHFSSGNLLYEKGDFAGAIDCYREAIALEPDNADAHNNLGNALQANRETQAAIATFQRSLQLRADSAETHYNLGTALQSLNRFDDAAAAYRRALQLQPRLVEAQNNLGIVLCRLGQPREAIECLHDALRLGLDIAAVHNNLGNAFSALSQFEEAARSFARAIELDAACVEAHNNLGTALHKMGRGAQAIACYRAAIKLRPDASPIFNNFGNVLKELGRLDEALACYDRALSLHPDDPDVYNNLGNALKDAGELDKAIECYRRALSLRPEHIGARSALLYALYFHPDHDAHSIFAEHLAWNNLHAASLERFIHSYLNELTPGRRLRIGYVSPDLREHAVGRFMLPLLANHDHRQFEVYCYCDAIRTDALTDRLRKTADTWRETRQLSDAQLAALIREDQIDILVDLTMHMAGNRLLAFARKPAPVQVTYLAYCGTTGLNCIDYRLSDSFLDPKESNNPYAEKTIRLPASYWCYQDPENCPTPGPLPASNAGHITFGCLNNYCKITGPTWTAWIEILRAVPDSRLVLHAYEGHHRNVARQRLERAGLDPARLDFVSFLPMASYLDQYQKIDIALDPFPYGGGTTTCDALWMGVPVVTLAGKTAVGRGGVSILSNIDRREWIAADVTQYIQIATDLANHLPPLAEIRATLRSRMLDSPLTDSPGFTRNVETAFKFMWQNRCVVITPG